MKTVAAISFLENRSISMDIEQVNRIYATRPMQLDDGSWCCELLVRTSNGSVALQLTADSADKLLVDLQGLE